MERSSRPLNYHDQRVAGVPAASVARLVRLVASYALAVRPPLLSRATLTDVAPIAHSSAGGSSGPSRRYAADFVLVRAPAPLPLAVPAPAPVVIEPGKELGSGDVGVGSARGSPRTSTPSSLWR